MAYKMKGFSGFKSSPAKQKITTIKHGKHKGHTKEVYKKGEEGYAGKGRGVVIKDKHNRVVETRGKGFKRTKKDEQQMKEINEMLSGKRPWPKKSPAKQEGPLPKENPNLKKSEMEGTWVYKGKNLNERAIDLDERASFIEEDISNTGKATKQQKKDIKFLDRERDIIKKRIKNTTKPYQRNVKPQYDDKGKRIKPPMAPKKKK